jgi:hypothetical protein
VSSRFNLLTLAASVLVGGLMALASTGGVAASTPLPGIATSNFVCNAGVCAIGPGDVGMSFAAGLVGTGGPTYYGPESNPYLMTVVTGSLPPGLSLGLPDTEWEITGTPTATGTYAFTIQIAAQAGGPDGTQQLSITSGAGHADRLLLTRAIYNSLNRSLQVAGFDVNTGAAYTVYATSSGAQIGTLGESSWNDGNLIRNILVSPNPGSVTVRDSLGGSAVMAVSLAKPRY